MPSTPARPSPPTTLQDTSIGSTAVQAPVFPPGDPVASTRVRARPERIGRFVVLDELGRGGMGVVYGAFDPELDRKVAIKLWRVGSATGRRDALLREARAMARVTHPNVIGVHDVGLHDEQPFLAMEYVRGRTLHAWLRESPRTWQAVLRVFIEAGRGLAAVHAAGLVHRDFKPENVMVHHDGRVQVADFGIAEVEPDDTAITASLVENETIGRFLGTPAFMAPEQFEHVAVDARADQFSYCVALFGALVGKPPYAGSGIGELLASMEAGTIRPVDRSVRAPAALMRAVERGLAIAPADRWPSMGALLDRLVAIATPRRRNLAVGLAVIATAGITSALWLREPACDTGGEAIASVWSDETASRAAAGFEAAAPSYGAAAWNAVSSRVDRIADQWRTERAATCGVADTSTRMATERCLADQLVGLATFLDLASDADEMTVRNAGHALAQLDEPRECADATLASQRSSFGEGPATMVRRHLAHLQLARVERLLDLRRYVPALEALRPVEVDAKASADESLIVEVLTTRGHIEVLAQDDDAVTTLREAYRRARTIGDGENASDAAYWLASASGLGERKFDIARLWASIAQTEADAAGIPVAAVSLSHLEGELRYLEGRWAEAVETLESTRAMGDALSEEERFAVESDLATVLSSVGRTDEALVLLRALLTTYVELRGEGHPDVADVWHAIGASEGERHHSAEAVQAYEQAMAIRERAFGPSYLSLATTLSNLASEQVELEQNAQARRSCERALAIFDENQRPRHPDSIACLNVLASLSWSEDWPATRSYLRRAIEVARESTEDHPTLASLLNNLAAAEAASGARDEAVVHFREAIAMRERLLGPDDPGLAYPLRGLGESLLELGLSLEARVALERAVASFERADGFDHGDYGVTLFALGRTYELDDPPRARSLVERAKAELERDDKSQLDVAKQRVAAWLGRADAPR